MASKPALRLVARPEPTAVRESRRMVSVPREDWENQNLEAAIRLDEARAHIQRSRLVLQLKVWTLPELAPLARPLLKELDRYERQISESKDAA